MDFKAVKRKPWSSRWSVPTVTVSASYFVIMYLQLAAALAMM